MRLTYPFIQLPIRFDADRLAREVATIDEGEWRPHPQKFPGNSMLPLVSSAGDPDIEYFAGPMRPTPYLERCPYMKQTFASVEAVIGRSRLMRLAGHAEVVPHADHGYYWIERTRIHIPIVTQPTVNFHCGDAILNMKPGECWIFDTWRPHRVVNNDDSQRIHLVIDTVGGPGFWNLVDRGSPFTADGPQRAIDPVRVEYREDARPAPSFENTNVPSIMSPWEMESHLNFLLQEAGENAPHLLRTEAADLVRDWRALWALHGANPEAKSAYAARLETFVDRVRGPASGSTLNNGGNLFKSINAMIATTAASGRVDKLRARGSAIADNA